MPWRWEDAVPPLNVARRGKAAMQVRRVRSWRRARAEAVLRLRTAHRDGDFAPFGKPGFPSRPKLAINYQPLKQ